MNFSKKNLPVILAFAVFVICVFLAFAAVTNALHNTTVKGTFIYISLFASLVLVAYIFAKALQNQQNTGQTSNLAQEQITEPKAEEKGETDTINNENTINTEAEIDFKKFLPKEKTKIDAYAEELLQNLAGDFQFVQAVFYSKIPASDTFTCVGQFAYYAENRPADFRTGETLPGQAVKNKTLVTLSNIPDKYMTIASGLGSSSPGYLTFVPIKKDDDVYGLIEFATFKAVGEVEQKQLNRIADKIGENIVKLIKK